MNEKIDTINKRIAAMELTVEFITGIETIVEENPVKDNELNNNTLEVLAITIDDLMGKTNMEYRALYEEYKKIDDSDYKGMLN